MMKNLLVCRYFFLLLRKRYSCLRSLLVMMMLLSAGQSSAKELPKMNFPMNGNMFVIENGSVGITHQAELPPTTNWSSYVNTPQNSYSCVNTIELRQVESVALPVQFEYSLQVEGTLISWKIGSTSPDTRTLTLTLHYGPTASTVRTLDYYSYSDAYKSEFTINELVLTTQGNMTQTELYTEVSKVVQLNFGVRGTSFKAPVHSITPVLNGPCVDLGSNELVINWIPVDFAEEYELEITFRDNYADDLSTPLPAGSIPYDFRENSTRIVTRNTYYRVPLTYERGYLLYRVRAVGMGGDKWDRRIPCRWSGPEKGTVGSFPDRYGPTQPHVGDRMNWQLTTTYSDEGKRKDVAQYYDGLFMNRQTVTGVSQKRTVFTERAVNNTVLTPWEQGQTLPSRMMADPASLMVDLDGPSPNPNDPDVVISPGSTLPAEATLTFGGSVLVPGPDQTPVEVYVEPSPVRYGCEMYGGEKIKEIIAQEVIYDFNGRPALQILPVPTGTHTITYIKKLSRNTSGNSYSWRDFDQIDNCELIAHPLTNDVAGALGAGAYYSPNNPNKVGYNAFIPDSRGFPFSRVQYTEDNTGRAYRQGGVGEVFQLERGHETKFYYAKPNQVELDRMFGTEVGYAVRYLKNMVIDPNGQVSVSYINPEGRTIATALAGVLPDNLMEVDPGNYPSEDITVDLLASNIPDSLEHSLSVNEQFLVTEQGEYTFTYTVNGQTLSYSSCAENSLCLDCIYDLDIRLIHNESCAEEPLVAYTGTFGDLVKETGDVNINSDCFGGVVPNAQYIAKPDGFPTAFTKTLEPGSYTLVKTLKVNEDAAEAYVQLVFMDTCTSVLEEFRAEEQALIDTTGCYRNCDSCLASSASTPEECEELCPTPLNECDRARKMLLEDVSLGGQYARYDVTPTGYDASAYPLSIFNVHNILPDNPNCLDITGTTDLKLLIEQWDEDAYPLKFIAFHPEYCMLEWCDQENTGADFDLLLAGITSFDEAVDSGLLDPSDGTPVYRQLLEGDPFFESGQSQSLQRDQQRDEFDAFMDLPCGNGEGKSLLEIVLDAAYCQSRPEFQNLESSVPDGLDIGSDLTQPSSLPCTVPAGYSMSHSFGSDPALKDIEWRLLRDLYLSYKEKYLYRSRTQYAVANGCFNGCIGREDYYYWPYPLPFPLPSSTQLSDGRSHSIPEAGLPVNDWDPCGIRSWSGSYGKKVKRFTNRYDAFSSLNVVLHGIDLYECLSQTEIETIRSQIGSLVDQYVCDSCEKSPVQDSCWLDAFTDLLDSQLPRISEERSVVTLGREQLSPVQRQMHYSVSGVLIEHMLFEYIGETGTYHIAMTYGNDSVCNLFFPATLVDSALKPLDGVCCPRMTNGQTLQFTLLYADGTSADISTVAGCSLPGCLQLEAAPACDTCSGVSQEATEFLLTLRQIRRQTNFPDVPAVHPEVISGGIRVTYGEPDSGTQGGSAEMRPGLVSGEISIIDAAQDVAIGEADREPNTSGNRAVISPAGTAGKDVPGACVLTFIEDRIYLNGVLVGADSVVVPNDGAILNPQDDAAQVLRRFPAQSSIEPSTSLIADSVPRSFSNRFPRGPVDAIGISQADIAVAPAGDPAVLQPASRSCTVTFENCDWLNDSVHLVSIRPFFPSGQGKVPTDEFILTYHRFNGDGVDTLTVHGTSACFTVNDCHQPYFCEQDSAWGALEELSPGDFNACVQSKLLTAEYGAYERYRRWADSMKADLRKQYYASCMGVQEQLNYQYTDRQFHFTLYYYDQAGNLVRTVPPAGVQLLAASQADNIDDSRDDGVSGTPIVPDHRYVTEYAYNSLNQVTWQRTPDAGETEFFYDRLGRIAASQNARQAARTSGNFYSYTWYDKLGRVVESGEVKLNAKLATATVSDYDAWSAFLYSRPRTEITYTQYDVPYSLAIPAMFGDGGQRNLRGRVASVFNFTDNTAQAAHTYRHATHYTYDVTGNVPILLQDYPNTPLGTKAIAYDFDLLTGKVNEVRYAPGQPDEFRHRYRYDDELRLTGVFTSRRGIIWETEAEYFYYKHGPLARTEIGGLKVQGLDYLYTLQGWIKGVNGTDGDRTEDAGHDGIVLEKPGPLKVVIINGQQVPVPVESDLNLNSSGPGYNSLHNPVAADAFGYVLSYYGDDYTPIAPGQNPTATMDAVAGDVQPLYNGNISRMYTWLGDELGGLGMNYRYDRLNRLKKQQGFEMTQTGQTLLANNAYGMELTYDGNGNILTMLRKGSPTTPDMDSLHYYYLDNAGGTIPDMANPPLNATNRLGHVDDDPGYTNNYPEAPSVIVNGTVTDIDNQEQDNYSYDEIGNLIGDEKEGINTISWNLQNKVEQIEKADGGSLSFAYDALGNRVRKTYEPGSTTPQSDSYPDATYYVRDAQGNIMAIYEVEDDGFFLREVNLYGSSRLGVWNTNIPMDEDDPGQSTGTDELYRDSLVRGTRQYELTNHLGNVLVTISDRRMRAEMPTTGSSGVMADVLTAGDYYAGGAVMPGRSASHNHYRFGFGGQEKESKIAPDGSVDFTFRSYDPQILRFRSVDPIAARFPYYSPYHFAGNNPILNIDVEGLEPFPAVLKLHNTAYRTKLALNGAAGVLFGTVGAVVSGGYMIGTAGAGVALGGAVGFTLSLGEVGIGINQIVDAFSERPNEMLHNTSSVFGKIAVAQGSNQQTVLVVDAVGQFVTGTFSGGTLNTFWKVPMRLSRANSVRDMFWGSLEIVDAAMDTRGVWNAAMLFGDVPGNTSLEVDVSANVPVSRPDFSEAIVIAYASFQESVATRTYTVRSGDVLSSIANKFDTTVDKLVEVNSIADRNKIYVGDQIIIE